MKKRIVKYCAVVALLVAMALVLVADVKSNSLSWQWLLPLLIALVVVGGWDVDGKKDDGNAAAADAYDPQTGGLKERLARVKTTRWVRFGIVSAIFLAWVVWLGNPWVLLAWPLLADIYLTQFIPWTWWRGIKNNALRTVMGWVDAIVYALVLVYFLFLFVGQNYQIPSSSLEKTLLTGDFLWVNKMVYGPRVPQTPLHFPLAQNMLPVFNCKSYIETPQFSYHRLKGLRSVEHGDIVVFNVPSGDTVALNCPNPDYYTLCFEAGMELTRGMVSREAIMEAGRRYIAKNRQQFGEVITRPVDRRDNYVKRCVGLPGDTLSVVDNHVVINGVMQPEPAAVQYLYYVHCTAAIDEATFERLGIAVDDRHMSDDRRGYLLPMTGAIAEQVKALPQVSDVNRAQAGEYDALLTYPVGYDLGWTHIDYGPIWIPKRGATIRLDKETLPLYERCISAYEGNTLKVKTDGTILINGEVATSYTFKMDYYWMMGDNRDNSLDSRYWGFVPEDHIVGTPNVVLVSFDKDKPLNNGGLRWNRVCITPNPDKR